MGINLYLASEYEYRRGLAHKLLEENVIDFCLTDHLPWTDAPASDDRIVTVNHNPSGNAEYSEVCDINELPALSKDLMEKMLPYESMAIKMGLRRFNYPTTEYEEEKRKYLQHLRFWNYMFDKYNINLIVTHCIPHSQGKFVVYALAKVRKIPMLIWHRSLFDGRCFWGGSLEEIGKSVGEKYLELTKNGINDFVLDEDIQQAYSRWGMVKQEYKTEKKKRNVQQRNLVQNIYENGYKNQRNEYYKKSIRSKLRFLLKKESFEEHASKDIIFRLYRRQLRATKYYKKYQCCDVDEYNKIAGDPDYSKKFICFLPQVSPEASTIPLAGVFAEQYNSIQLLARAAEKEGVYVYVKEHPHNVYRSKDFYEQIVTIKNVKLIKTTVPSEELLKNCLAMATQTGSILLEALCQHKPSIVFGNGYYWKNCPGIFEMTDEDQGAELIGELINGIEIKDEDVKRYFYAIQLESIKEVSEFEETKRIQDDKYEITPFPLEDRVDLIKRFIQSNISN